MDISTRISLLSILGQQLNSFLHDQQDSVFNEQLKNKIIENEIKNPWFTSENVRYCLIYWSKVLNKENLTNWIELYDSNSKNKKVGIVMAGNIPMVGFHDLLCVFISGNIALVKTSLKDNVLIPFFINYLTEIEPKIAQYVQFIEKFENFDAVIATGSNNTARYFEYYFKDKPNIIRKSRTSVAVLTGNESKEDLVELSNDIFRYFGLGCRNVTKLYLPKAYDLNTIFEAFYGYNYLQHHNKYFNNYTYHKAIYLMNQDKFLDNGFFMLKADKNLFSPISCLYYEEYENLQELENELISKQNEIQTIVTNKSVLLKLPAISFGKTQQPNLYDYADGVDVLKFLSDLK